jgi:hypothetical protein
MLLTQHHAIFSLDQSVLHFPSSFSTTAVDLFLACNGPPGQPTSQSAGPKQISMITPPGRDAEGGIYLTLCPSVSHSLSFDLSARSASQTTKVLSAKNQHEGPSLRFLTICPNLLFVRNCSHSFKCINVNPHFNLLLLFEILPQSC